jgi:hypothetical protein
MYMGWAFAPERHASTYLATGLARMGRLYRHGTFVALRAQVERRAERGDAYKDVATAARIAPRHWLVNAARFGYTHLIERLESGDVPSATPFRNVSEGAPESHLAIAWQGLAQAERVLERRLTPADVALLLPLRQRVVELLPVLDTP